MKLPDRVELPRTKLVLGVDPDTQATGLALCSKDKVLIVGLASIERYKARGLNATTGMCNLLGYTIRTHFRNADQIVIEFPQHYGVRGRANPNNLMLLAAVSGAAAGAGYSDVTLTRPGEWKGQVPKAIHHRRILEHYGWEFKDNGKKKVPTPIVPDDVKIVGDVPAGRWKEIVDAMGLCKWALQ